MDEANLTKTILLAIGKLPFLKIFRNNVGMGWQGEAVANFTKNGARFVTLKNPRPLHAGLCNGSADLIGWRVVKVTPEMVGKELAVFTALEIKTATGRPSPEQVNFLNVLQDGGGIAGIVRSPEEAYRILKA